MEVSQTRTRQKEVLRRALRSEILGPLEDPHVVEIMLNPDGALWVDRLGTGMTLYRPDRCRASPHHRKHRGGHAYYCSDHRQAHSGM